MISGAVLIEFIAGSSLMAQWLRVHASNAGDLGLIPSQRIKSHMLQLKRSHMLHLRPGVIK